ncbi:MAG: signal peptide peptidase SppA [Armatimonadetes bacterium]|nr:signal peptide peptidase SppA [Armatimonadota bacterium]
MTWILDLVRNGLLLLCNALARLPGPPLDYVVVELTGSYPERNPTPRPLAQRVLMRPLQRPEESMEALRDRLERIAGDERVRGIVLRVRDLRAGMATVQSIRSLLREFRGRGKRVVAYLQGADLPEYYLAAAADEIWMPEAGHWTVLGLRTEITFFREAFDRAGILPEFERIAEYKTAVDPFMRFGLSEHHREVVESVLDSVMAEFAEDVAAARRLDPGAVRAAVDRAPLCAHDAWTAGLVDGICYEDELPARLGSPARPAALRPWAQARRRLRAPYRWRSRTAVIGVVELIGTITTGESRDLPLPLPFLGGRFAGSETVARAFRAAERDPRVRAVVFHVDSRGGSALASDLIWREVERIKASKPVVAFMGNVAGSGGYYVSCGASRIVAQPATVTGSIGVINGKLTVRGLFGRLGLNREVVARGEAATMPSGFEPFTPTQLDRIRHEIQAVYRRFVGKAARGRAKTEAEIEAIARGRVWTGRQAVEHGLVDEIGDFPLAVRRARELAGIPDAVGSITVTIRPPHAAAVPAASNGPAASTGFAAVAEAVEAFRIAAGLAEEGALLLMPQDQELLRS